MQAEQHRGLSLNDKGIRMARADLDLDPPLTGGGRGGNPTGGGPL